MQRKRNEKNYVAFTCEAWYDKCNVFGGKTEMKENKSLEFKATITNSFLKTVSAYSNFRGGEILFGVNDDGSVCGIDNPDQVCLDIENRINDSIAPKPDFEIDIDDSKKIIR